MLCIYYHLPNAIIIANQVRHKGVWGTVCSSSFGKGEASVFCRFPFLRTMQPLFNIHHIVNNFGRKQTSSACLLADNHVVIIALIGGHCVASLFQRSLSWKISLDRMLGYEGNATFESLGKDLLQIRQRKGSWPIWITLQEEGTYIFTIYFNSAFQPFP